MSDPHKLPWVSDSGNPAGKEGMGLPRLPPGRHGLPREFVTQNQRDRLAAATIQVIAERGYHKTTVSQIVAAAGLGRRTFYSYFSSKKDCYVATYNMIAQHLLTAAAEAAAEQESWPGRVRAAIGAALETFAANPDLVRFMLIAPPRAGEPIAGRYRKSAGRAVEQLNVGLPADVQLPSEAVRNAVIGGMAALVARKVEDGEGEQLLELLPDLVELFLTPYLGREAAARAAGEAR